MSSDEQDRPIVLVEVSQGRFVVLLRSVSGPEQSIDDRVARNNDLSGRGPLAKKIIPG